MWYKDLQEVYPTPATKSNWRVNSGKKIIKASTLLFSKSRHYITLTWIQGSGKRKREWVYPSFSYFQWLHSMIPLLLITNFLFFPILFHLVWRKQKPFNCALYHFPHRISEYAMQFNYFENKNLLTTKTGQAFPTNV